jgi:hypothetical protein
MVEVVVGDRAQFEDGIREIGFGDIRFTDADGRVVDR